MLPSSFGLTFTAGAEAQEIQITARWGRYERLSSEELGLEVDKPHMVWKRHPEEHTSPPIHLKPGRMPRWTPNPNFPDIYVEGLLRQRNGEWVITLFLRAAQPGQKRVLHQLVLHGGQR